MHTETGYLSPSSTSPQASRCVNKVMNVVHCENDHSLAFGEDTGRSGSISGWDLTTGGDDAADGGEVVDSRPSRAASALVYISARCTDSNTLASLPESICAGLILRDWWCTSPATASTTLALSKQASSWTQVPSLTTVRSATEKTGGPE